MNSVISLLANSFTDGQGELKELIFSVHHTFFATVVLACVFIPKIDILVFHPEKDVLFDALSTTVTPNMDSTFRLNTRKTSIPKTPVSASAPEM